MKTLSLDIELSAPFPEAVERVTAALKTEGFGILTRVDVQQAFKEKLDKEFRPYVILGACNPPLAYEALSARPEVGLLLPCNVTVEETSAGHCLVRIVNPGALMQLSGFDQDKTLSHVGTEADERLKRVADSFH